MIGRVGLNEVSSQHRGNRSRPIVHTEFDEDPGDVALHRSGADKECLANLAIRQPGDEELKNVSFAQCEGTGRRADRYARNRSRLRQRLVQ